METLECMCACLPCAVVTGLLLLMSESGWWWPGIRRRRRQPPSRFVYTHPFFSAPLRPLHTALPVPLTQALIRSNEVEGGAVDTAGEAHSHLFCVWVADRQRVLLSPFLA